MEMRYSGRRAIVTGGLGFIGSNLVLRLLDEGARGNCR
jgi:nucleoside-diphosphate-sugar epimerase